MKGSCFGALALLAAACGGPSPNLASGPKADLPKAFANALRADASGDGRDAVKAELDVVRLAAADAGNPWQVPALEAALDALATRHMPSLSHATDDAALAWRTPEGAAIPQELLKIEGQATGTFARALVARALGSMAQRHGNAAEAATQRAASGCATQAVVVGPLTWAPVTGVEEVGPLDAPGARLEASYPVGDAFGSSVHPIVVSGHGCELPLGAESTRPGVREVVVDVEVPRDQVVGLVLRSHGAAVLRAGGVVVARRPFEAGDGEAARFGRVRATQGVLRIAARVGAPSEQDTVEIDVLGEDGAPLRTSAATSGAVPTSRATMLDAAPLSPKGTEETLLAAAATIASGASNEAEAMLWAAAIQADAPPELALAYARAVEQARDLSSATRDERARSAYERVLEVWPSSWEAIVAHAVLAGQRRGRDEAGVETLRDLDALRDKAAKASAATQAGVLDAFDTLTSGRTHLFDRARTALGRARSSLGGTELLAQAEDVATPRTGSDLVTARCDAARATRDSLSCFDALRGAGDHAGAAKELARLRTVVGESLYLPAELRDALATRDDAVARRVFAAMLPAERTLSAMSLLEDGTSPAPPERGLHQGDGASPEARATFLRAAVMAPDAPLGIAPLLRVLGDDPTREFDGMAENLAQEDRSSPILPNAATAVLAHKERYSVEGSGLVHWLLFDVRRVSGTTDVEENAQASAPDIWGRSMARSLRRRIIKHDGRVLEPERAPHASQAHADLSQLERGDVVEAIYEGWALPGETGDLGIDTPDLLPPRTAVHDATIELRLPAGVKGALWSHGELGKGTERADGGSRVLTWHLVDHGVRRLEDGVPRMDRSANVSFSTTTWTTIARALRETVATLDDHGPEMAKWAHALGGDAPAASQAGVKEVEEVVTAAGKALREAEPGTLSDYGGGVTAVQTQTARTFLASHDGSRSWLVLRALRELGIKSDLVVAENEPFSSDPAFPPHFGRFVHPLVVAHAPGQDIWIDADVRGPPLPAGRISPELRGRLAMGNDGAIAPLPARAGEHAGEERDEVDVRLALDGHGDARGTFTVVLRGRQAQELAEALVRLVGAERKRALRDVVLCWLPWANVESVDLSSSEGSWQVSLRADVTVNGYAQLEGNKTWLLPGIDTLHWPWPRARVSSLGATFATRAGRESALALSTAVQYHVHRRVVLPAGATVAKMPAPLDVKAKLVQASRKIAVDGQGQAGGQGGAGQTIDDDFVLGVATGTIAKGDYDAFVSVAHAADDGFLASTRVTRGP
jgi:hypothetical protein